MGPNEADGITFVTWVVMGVVMLCMLSLSSFFSASEAALFSLTMQQRSRLQNSRLADRMIESLLGNATRLLSCILLCNLAVNTTFFACANIISTDLIEYHDQEFFAVVFGVVSVASVIAFGELLPKSVGVLAPLRIARMISIPLSIVMWICGPFAMTMSFINDILRRLLWPGLVAESSMELTDLERAIELSEANSKLVDLEKSVLQNVIQLATAQAQDWMRPRSEFRTLHLPASREKMQVLQSDMLSTRSGVPIESQRILVLAGSGGDVVAITTLSHLMRCLRLGGELTLDPLDCIPWCASLANTLQEMIRQNRQAALVVNERGESIGVLLQEDLMEAVFAVESSNAPGLSSPHFAKTGQTQWEVTGITRIRQLERSLGLKLPPTRDATIAGLLQSELRRLAQVGDQVHWGPLELEVVEKRRRGEMLVRIRSSEIQVDVDAEDWEREEE